MFKSTLIPPTKQVTQTDLQNKHESKWISESNWRWRFLSNNWSISLIEFDMKYELDRTE